LKGLLRRIYYYLNPKLGSQEGRKPGLGQKGVIGGQIGLEITSLKGPLKIKSGLWGTQFLIPLIRGS